MKKIVYLIIMIITSCSNTKYIQFVEKNNQAKKLYNNKQYCESKEILEDLYKRIKNKFPDGYFNLAKSIYLCDNEDKEDSYTYFELSIKENGIPLKFYIQLENDSLFSTQLLQDQQWQQMISNYPKYYQEYEQDLDLDLKKMIDSLIVIDQEVRNNRESYANIEEFEKEVERLDSSNFFILKKLIKEKGLPTRFKIGRSSSDFITMMYHYHTNDKKNKEWNCYLDKIKRNAAQKGGFSNLYLITFFIDKSYYGSTKYGGTQLYGTMDKDSQILPIIDIKNVDKRRRKMGQEPLYKFAKENNLILPKDYTYKIN